MNTTTRAMMTVSSLAVADALKAAKRKGWGLDGMSTEKLEEVERYLRVNLDDDYDY